MIPQACRPAVTRPHALVVIWPGTAGASDDSGAMSFAPLSSFTAADDVSTHSILAWDYSFTGPTPSGNGRHHRMSGDTSCGPDGCQRLVRAMPQGGGKAARQIGQPASALISIQRWRQCEWKKWLHGVSIRDDARSTCDPTWFLFRRQLLCCDIADLHATPALQHHSTPTSESARPIFGDHLTSPPLPTCR